MLCRIWYLMLMEAVSSANEYAPHMRESANKVEELNISNGCVCSKFYEEFDLFDHYYDHKGIPLTGNDEP